MKGIKIIKKSKKILGQLSIGIEYQDIVMFHAGYDKLANGRGWVRRFALYKRFHVQFNAEKGELHLDQTINGYHNVARENSGLLKIIRQERKSIQAIWRTYNPVRIERERLLKEHRKTKKKKVMFAPNALALQRGQKLEILYTSPNTTPMPYMSKPPWYWRINNLMVMLRTIYKRRRP